MPLTYSMIRKLPLRFSLEFSGTIANPAERSYVISELVRHDLTLDMDEKLLTFVRQPGGSGDMLPSNYNRDLDFSAVTSTSRLGVDVSLINWDYYNEVIGSGLNDTIRVASGSMRVDGGRGNDRLVGGADRDNLFGGAGDDVLLGGAGNDRFEAIRGGTDKSGNDLIDGGTGWDEVVLAYDRFERVGGDLIMIGANGRDTLRGIENVNGLYTGLDRPLDLVVTNGRLEMRADADFDGALGYIERIVVNETGGRLIATVTEVMGRIEPMPASWDVDITGAAAVLNVDADVEWNAATPVRLFSTTYELRGGSGNDTLESSTVYGGGGDDLLSGWFADGGDGNDRITECDSFSGGAGNDWINGFDGDAGSGNDTIVSTGYLVGKTTLLGGDGNDLVTATYGFNRIEGGSGNDTMGGGQLADTLLGGAGDDLFLNHSGDDVFAGGAGIDTLELWGKPADWQWTRTATGFEVSWRLIEGFYGTDQCTGIEFLRFTDGSVIEL